jgi:hypothetical protein
VLFDEWARICDGPGSNDKAYAIYLSQLQHLGMLKGDHLTDIVSPFSMDNLLRLTIFTA